MGKNASMAALIQSAKLMAGGIEAKKDILAKSDLDEAKAKAIRERADKVSALDEKQEQLKAQLKACTAEIDAEQDALESELAAAKKTVKYFVPKEDWKAFGIDDKR